MRRENDGQHFHFLNFLPKSPALVHWCDDVEYKVIFHIRTIAALKDIETCEVLSLA